MPNLYRQPPIQAIHKTPLATSARNTPWLSFVIIDGEANMRRLLAAIARFAQSAARGGDSARFDVLAVELASIR